MHVTFKGPIHNVCSNCNHHIQIRRSRDLFLASCLQNSETAICNICDPLSSWKRISNAKKHRARVNIDRSNQK